MMALQRILDTLVPEPNTGCWLWPLCTNKKGYGSTVVGSRSDGTRRHAIVHRYVYEAINGPLPDGWFACHKCDTPPCANPEHLFAGTHLDNARDRERKGRGNQARGVRNGNAKLTEAAAAKIVEMRKAGATFRQIADALGISEGPVGSVLSGETWRHVTEEIGLPPRVGRGGRVELTVGP